MLGPEVLDAYVASVVALAPTDDATRAAAERLRIVLTPLHGVGGEVARRVLAEAGFTDVLVVPEQVGAGPATSRHRVPQPRGAGCDRPGHRAGQRRARGPGDRPRPRRGPLRGRDPGPAPPLYRGPDTAEAEGWRILHGDETGSLLGKSLAGTTPRTGPRSPARSSRRGCSARSPPPRGTATRRPSRASSGSPASTASCSGTKRRSGTASTRARARQGRHLGGAPRCWSRGASQGGGRTVVDALDDLAREHGLHLTDQVSARFSDLSQIGETVHRLRNRPPRSLGGSRVSEVVDLATGSEDDRDGLPPTEGLRLLTTDGTRVIVRPSGTEPKVKCYLEVVVPLDPGADHKAVGRARHDARARLDAVAADVRVALGI